jgi:hypothetical protein
MRRSKVGNVGRSIINDEILQSTKRVLVPIEIKGTRISSSGLFPFIGFMKNN